MQDHHQGDQDGDLQGGQHDENGGPLDTRHGRGGYGGDPRGVNTPAPGSRGGGGSLRGEPSNRLLATRRAPSIKSRLKIAEPVRAPPGARGEALRRPAVGLRGGPAAQEPAPGEIGPRRPGSGYGAAVPGGSRSRFACTPSLCGGVRQDRRPPFFTPPPLGPGSAVPPGPSLAARFPPRGARSPGLASRTRTGARGFAAPLRPRKDRPVIPTNPLRPRNIRAGLPAALARARCVDPDGLQTMAAEPPGSTFAAPPGPARNQGSPARSPVPRPSAALPVYGRVHPLRCTRQYGGGASGFCVTAYLPRR